MTLNEYQYEAQKVSTWAPGGEKSSAYYALKLNGEAGEVAELIGKAWRGDYGPTEVMSIEAIFKANPELKNKLVRELGDVLWYVQKLASKIDIQLADVARENLNKLQARVDNVSAGRPAKDGEGR